MNHIETPPGPTPPSAGQPLIATATGPQSAAPAPRRHRHRRRHHHRFRFTFNVKDSIALRLAIAFTSALATLFFTARTPAAMAAALTAAASITAGSIALVGIRKRRQRRLITLLATLPIIAGAFCLALYLLNHINFDDLG